MRAGTLSQAAHTTPATQIVDTEAPIDMQRLRAYRLRRVREQLERAGCAACVLFDPISIRYATGFRSYALFQMHIPLSYLFLPVHGPVVLFAIDRIHHLARQLETIDEVRPGVPPTFYGAGPRLEDAMLRWADELVELFTSRFRGEKRLAVGRTDARMPLRLCERGIEVVDAQELVERARLVKSPDEILCMNVSVAHRTRGILPRAERAPVAGARALSGPPLRRGHARHRHVRRVSEHLLPVGFRGPGLRRSPGARHDPVRGELRRGRGRGRGRQARGDGAGHRDGLRGAVAVPVRRAAPRVSGGAAPRAVQRYATLPHAASSARTVSSRSSSVCTADTKRRTFGST
ncbi:MAG: hypothetical protein GWO02_18895 [Gammaproteobacteria bacterium]|nr:hypothetical protein [Gammaproteobacteria bacterium]